MLATIHEEVAVDGGGPEAGGEEDEARGPNPSNGWALGVKGRTRGSLHSDCWEGPASELVEMRHLVGLPGDRLVAFAPVGGRGRFADALRAGGVVGGEQIRAVDLYSEIETQITVPIPAT